jgi:hypothetical protein
MEQDIAKVEPEPGIDRAIVRRVPWCEGLTVEGSADPRFLAVAYNSQYDEGLFKAARKACQWPDEPAVQ